MKILSCETFILSKWVNSIKHRSFLLLKWIHWFFVKLEKSDVPQVIEFVHKQFAAARGIHQEKSCYFIVRNCPNIHLNFAARCLVVKVVFVLNSCVFSHDCIARFVSLIANNHVDLVSFFSYTDLVKFVTNFIFLPPFLLEYKTSVRNWIGEDTAFYDFFTVLKIFSMAWKQDEELKETNQ